MSNERRVMEKGSEGAAEKTQRLAMLRDSATKYASRDSHLKRSRKLRGTSPGYDRDVWREMAGLGWLASLLPERFGGLDLGYAEMAIIAEALGRSLFPEPLVSSVVLAAGTVLYGDNEALKKELLPRVAEGEMVPALAWREQGHSSEPLKVETQADETSNGVKISGFKHMVMGGASADGFVVTARGRQGIGLYWVPFEKAASGLSQIELADGRPAAILNLAGVVIPSGNCIAQPGRAEAALLRAYDEALIMTAAELLGVLSRALEITLDYLRTREQFGKLIGSFQALQHRAANLYIEQRMCRHTVDDVIAKASAQNLSAKERGALASRAKARCSEVSLHITREAIQMHGAIGFSDECDIGLFLKRAVTLAGWLGGAETHRRRYAQLAPHDAEAADSRGKQ